MPATKTKRKTQFRYDRCVCADMSFAEIKAEAKRQNIKTIKGLKSKLPLGPYCSACAPYLMQMLKTGKTVFTEPINEY